MLCMQNLEQDLEQMRFPADLSLIKRHYSFLTDLERNFPSKLTSIYTLINRQTLVSTLKKHEAIVLKGFERDFLQKFYGRLEEDFNYSQDLEERCQAAVNQILAQEEAMIPEDFQKIIQQTIYKQQLEFVRVPLQCHGHALSFSRKVRRLHREILSRYKQEQMRPFPLSEFVQEKFPKLLKQLNLCKEKEIKQSYIQLALQLLDRLHGKESTLERWALSEFEEAILQFTEDILNTLPPFDAIERAAEQRVEDTDFTDRPFYEYLAATLPVSGIFEYFQGEDGPGTNLERGVCTGLCIERALLFLQNPDAALEREAFRTISPSARTLQAFYEIMQDLPNLQKRKRASLEFPKEVPMLIPKKLQEMLGINWSDTKCFTLNNYSLQQAIGGIFERFGSVLSYWEEPSCFLAVGIAGGGGHSLYMRFDHARGRYIFFDANYGIFELKTGIQDEGMAWLFHTLIQCLNTYEQIISIRVNNYIIDTRETKETLEEETLRYRFVTQFLK